MRKVLLFVWIFSFAEVSVAQNIPNGDMETWVTVGSYDDPQGWFTTNGPLVGFGGSANVTKETTDKYAGSASAKLVSAQSPIGASPGAMVAGSATIGLGGLSLKGGFAYAVRAKTFSGTYKYTPGPGDSSLFQAWLFKWNSATMKRDTVAFARLTQGNTVSSYTTFSVDFVYNRAPQGGLVPDSALVLVSTSSNLTGAKLGSVLYCDNLSFSGEVPLGIKNNVEKPSVTLYPNPVSSIINFKVNNGAVKRIVLYDILGKKIKSIEVESMVTSISTDGFQNGLYFYQLTGKENEVISTGRFSVKK